MDVVVPRCAGLDVHKETVVACARVVEGGGKVRKQVRTFGTMTRDLQMLREWLCALGITHVAMESTGVYWKPIFNVLEEAFEVLLCNAQHVSRVPGRKTDVTDSEWLSHLLACGLLTGSFVPPAHLRELRDLTRTRAKLRGEYSRVANRLQKTLEDANVKLSSVVTDVLGVSGRAMLRALVDGESDPVVLANLARRQLRGKIPQLRLALEGRVTEHHRFMLRCALTHLDQIDTQIGLFDERIREITGQPPPDGDGPDSSGERAEELVDPPPNEAAGEAPRGAPPMAREVALLTTIPGVGTTTAENVLAEIGTDMSRFPTPGHLAAWAGLCPGNDQSAGKSRGKGRKGNVWLRRALVQAAPGAGRTKNSYFSVQLRRLQRRRGKKRALVAVAHSILTIIHRMLTTGQPYREVGADYFDRIERARLERYHLKRLEQLGCKVTVHPAA